VRRPWGSEPTPAPGRLWIGLVAVLALEYSRLTRVARDHGAHRIIDGAGGQLYWTDDHHRSFERISP